MIAADNVASAFGTGLGIAFFIFLTGATLATALACLKRGRADIVALVSIAAAGLALDMIVLAVWLDIENEAYAKIAGVAFVWSVYALIVGLMLALGTPGNFARPLYFTAVVVAVVAGLITSWFVVSASEAEITSVGLVPEGVLEDDSFLRALGAALVLLAALWFGALAASRIDEHATVTEQWQSSVTR